MKGYWDMWQGSRAETTVEGQSCTHGYLYEPFEGPGENVGREWLQKTPGNKRQKRSSNVVFVDDFDNRVIRNTKNVGIMWRKCQLKREIPVGRADIVTWKSRYLEEVQEYRDNGHLMFYTHKTWTDSNLTFRSCWQEGKVIGILLMWTRETGL